MRHGFTGSILIAALVSLAAITAAAQTAAIPRTPDGRPNLQGIWQVLAPAAWDIQDHSPQLGMPAGQGVVEGNDLPTSPGRSSGSRRTSLIGRPRIPSRRAICQASRASCTCRFRFRSSRRRPTWR